MATEQHKLGHNNGSQRNELSWIAKAFLQMSNMHLKPDTRDEHAAFLGVGGANFHNPKQREVEHGRM
jgi:hypothetical protein